MKMIVGATFHFKEKSLNFGPNLPIKGVSETAKVNINIKSCILELV